MTRRFLPFLVALAACGEPVGDPLAEEWRASPNPVLGGWLLVAESRIDADHPLLIEIGGPGVFSGGVAFPLFSQEFFVPFFDGRAWDGRTFRFTSQETFGLNLDGPYEWRVQYVPPSETTCFEPQLRVEGIREFVYVRPGAELRRCGASGCACVPSD